MFGRWSEVERIISCPRLRRCHSQDPRMALSVRTTRTIGSSLRSRSGNLSQSSAYHLQSGQELITRNQPGENSLRGVEQISMPDDPYINGRENEQVSGCVQIRNPTFKPVAVCNPSEGRLWRPSQHQNIPFNGQLEEPYPSLLRRGRPRQRRYRATRI